MIASLLIAAAAVLPPEGPLVWKGAPVELVERVKYYRIVPMKEPELVPSERARYWGRNLDLLVKQFAETQTADDAFTVFNRLATDLGTNAYATVSSSCDYLVRFAAARGHKKAREFFDEEGHPLTGLAFEYVLAKYRQYYSGRDELPRPERERGFGDSPATAIRPYACDGELQALLDRYGMTAKWYEDRLPFLEFTPKDCPADEVPLVVYIPGSGEQGADIAVQFKQRACLEKVVSAEFQKRHPCRFMVICLPAGANCNIGDGYPDMRDKRSDLYYDMILASAKHADGPKVDPRRIYLTGLGSGASIACGLALDHPGRFAAVAPVWGHPRTTLVHPRAPGNWRFYNTFDPEHPKPSHDMKLMQFYAQRFKGFTENVRSAGGDCAFLCVPEVETGWWWDAVWSGDEVYDWMFGKTAFVAPHVGEASPPPQE